MNIKQLDVNRLVSYMHTLQDYLNEAEICIEKINEIIKASVLKEGKLNYIYENDEK